MSDFTTRAAAATKYGTAEHAAVEAIIQSIYNSDGWVNAEATSIADVVVAGLRARGFAVHREARCECGWTGEHNHYHDARMGRAAPALSTAAPASPGTTGIRTCQCKGGCGLAAVPGETLCRLCFGRCEVVPPSSLCDELITKTAAEWGRDLLDHEREVREQVARFFERLASNRNPDDPEGSAAYSRWAMNAAERIRHPEHEGCAADGE